MQLLPSFFDHMDNKSVSPLHALGQVIFPAFLGLCQQPTCPAEQEEVIECKRENGFLWENIVRHFQ